MRKWLILLSALLVTPVIGAPAWTWVDANGTVHYSDTPVPGAKQIELTGAQGFGRPPRSTAATQGSANTQPAQPSTAYRVFNVMSPTQQETLWNTGGNLNVQLAIEPRLQSNHQIDVLIDGQRRNLNVTTPQLTVPDVFRGIHTMQAVIVDQRGTEVLRSPATTFMVQQTSIQNPNATANTPAGPPGANPPLPRPPVARPPIATPRQNGGN